MKSRDTLMRLKRFQVEDLRRRVAQIETMIGDFSRMTVDLDREIAVEEGRSGIADPTHFAYPTYAKAARTRRENLKRSADELRSQLADARDHHVDAIADLEKVQSLDGREKAAERAEAEGARV